MDNFNNNNEQNKKEPIQPIMGQPYYFDDENQSRVQASTINKNNGYIGVSIASMVLGILGLLCCYCGILFSIIGLVLGCVSCSQNYDGKGMAIAGIVMGAVGIGLSIILVTFSGFANFYYF